MSKPIVSIYVNPNSETTHKLDLFLAKHIDQINEHLYIKRVRVTENNAPAIKRLGIERTPTLVYGGRKYVSLERIMQILSPPSSQKSHYGYGNTSPDEMVHDYMTALVDFSNADDEGENDDYEKLSADKRSDFIRRRIEAMQKRRPKMIGVEGPKKVEGGRDIKTRVPRKKYTEEESDERFLADAVGTVTETPTKHYFDDMDGASLWEEYKLSEAASQRRSPDTTRWRRPTIQ